jgi:phosphinothricin acetyltransferase
MIRPVKHSDAAQLAEIYNYYIANSTATFETETVVRIQMEDRIMRIQNDLLPWFVAENPKGIILGYAYASMWKERKAYKHSVEITVYLDHNVYSQGIGSQLYTALFNHLKTLGVHAVMGGISLPNKASVALHEKFGMTKVAHFSEVGYKFGEWVDVGYWQAILKT